MIEKHTNTTEWDTVIESEHSLFDINFKELWHYREADSSYKCNFFLIC